MNYEGGCSLMRTYLKRTQPVQVRRENRETLAHTTLRPGKVILWERVGILKVGKFQLKSVKFLTELTSMLIFASADGKELVCYDHRSDVVARVRQFLMKEISLEKLLGRIELECRIELMKKMQGGRENFFCNFYHRPAGTKATSHITIEDISKNF